MCVAHVSCITSAVSQGAGAHGLRCVGWQVGNNLKLLLLRFAYGVLLKKQPIILANTVANRLSVYCVIATFVSSYCRGRCFHQATRTLTAVKRS